MIILTRKHLDVEHITPASKIAGYFTIRKFKNGNLVQQVGPFKNLITDYGLNKLGGTQVSLIYNSIHVGTGTATPDPADVTLQSYLAGQSIGTVSFNYSGAPDYYSARRMVALFDVGAVVGNVTEVGIFQAPTNGNTAFARALTVDIVGTPVAIPVLADEQLEITYELRHYPPLEDVEATVTVGPNSHDTVTRAIAANTQDWAFPSASGTNQAYFNTGNVSSDVGAWWTGDLVALTATAGAGTKNTISGLGTAAYGSNNLYRDLSSSSNPANGARTNIRTVTIEANCCAFQTRYDPVLSKTADQTMTLWTRFSWGRV